MEAKVGVEVAEDEGPSCPACEAGVRASAKLFATMLILCSIADSCAVRRYTRKFNLEQSEVTAEFIEPVRITSGIDSNFLPSLSPNGAFVLFTSDRADNKDIWEKSTSGGYPRMISTHSADDFGAVISPDGRQAAFVSRRADASGDIHVLDLTASIAGSLSKNEGLIDRIALEKTEDINPAWFPNSKRIVFSSRFPGETKSRLMTAYLSDLKAEQVEKIFGEQPAVSPDGDWIAYIYNSTLFVYSEQDKKAIKLTTGETIQDGQPQFSQDGKRIFFIRYADDTNADGLINGDDRPSIWQLDFERQRKAKSLENYAITPLTSARLAVYSPNHRPPNIYFTRQTKEGIDIFSLPEGGQIKIAKTYDKVMQQFDDQDDPYDKLFILRRAQSYFQDKAKWDALKRIVLFELEWLVANKKAKESSWVDAKIRANFADDKHMLASAEISLLTQTLAPLIFPLRREPLTAEETESVHRHLNQLERMVSGVDTGDASGRVTMAKKMVLNARILISLGQPKAAQDVLERVAAVEDSDAGTWTKQAALVNAELAQFLSGSHQAFPLFAEVFTKYGQDRNFCETAASAMLKEILTQPMKTKISQLAKLKIQAQDLPCLPVFVQLQLADAFLEDRKLSIVVSELQEMLAGSSGNPKLLLQVSHKLAGLLEGEGRFEDAEKIYRSLAKTLVEKSFLQVKAMDFYLEFLLRKAARNANAGEWDEALAVYRKILKQDDSNIAAHRGIIDLKFLQKRLDAQIEDYKVAIQEDSPTARKLFFLAYALSYTIDAQPDLSERLEIIDDCILLLERARQKNAQLPEVAQQLGVLYDKKDKTLKQFFAQGGFRSFSKKAWAGTKDFFGFSDPQWLELSLDSYLSAYFLSEENSTQRLDIMLNLGDAFYELGVYAKSLNYYMLRLKNIETTPLANRFLEARMYYKAARAAYYSDDLKVAEALAKRSLKQWQELKVDQEVARSLDYLAFVMREQKRFEDASIVYKRLLQENYRLGNKWNILGTQLNLAYCFWQSNQLSSSLAVLEKADSFLRKFERRKDPKASSTDSPETENIKIDIGGQETAAKGFDAFKRRLLYFTIKERVYANLGLYESALRTLDEKYDFTEAEKKEGKNKKETYLQEDLSINANNIGNFHFQKADYEKAAKLYQKAAESAKILHARTDAPMSSSEWLNQDNYLKTQIRLMDLGVLNRKNIHKLEDEIKQLEKATPTSQPEILASLDMHKAQINIIANREQAVQPVLNQVRKYSRLANLDSDILDFTYLNIDYHTIKGNKENLLAQRSQFRKKAIADPEISWKYFASLGLWQDAFLALVARIKQGESLSEPSERILFRKVFEGAWRDFPKNPGGEKAAHLFFRNYQNLRVIELANRTFQLQGKPHAKIVAKLKPLFETRSDDSLQTHIRPDELVLTAYNEIDPVSSDSVLHLTLQGRQTYLHLRNAEVAGLFADIPSDVLQTARKIYVVAAGDSFTWEWEKLGRPLAFIPSIDCLPTIKAWQHLPKESLGHLSSDDSGLRRLMARGDSQRSYQKIRRSNKKVDPFNLRRYNLLHVDEPFYLSDIAPAFSLISAKELPLSLSSFAELDLRNTALLSFANVTLALEKELHAVPEAHEGWMAVALAGFAAEVPTTVLSMAKNDTPSAWQDFYQRINNESFAQAAMQSNLHARVLGYWGSDTNEEIKLAPTAISHNLAQGERALEAKDMERAIGYYRNALYYAKRLGSPDVTVDILGKLVNLYAQTNDFSQALFYKKQMAQRSKGGSEYAKHLMEAGSYALHERDFAGAEAIFSEANVIFSANHQRDMLGELLRFQGKLKRDQGKFEEAIALLKAARDNFTRVGDAVNASLCGMEMGRIYAYDLSDPLTALGLYTQVGSTLQELSPNKHYPKLLLEMVRIYRKWDQPAKAIRLLRDAEFVVDKSKNLGVLAEIWGELAETYTEVGLNSKAQVLLEQRKKINAKIFPLLEQKQHKVVDLLLQARVAANSNLPAESEKFYNEAILSAKSAHDTQLILTAYLELAHFLQMKGNYERGLLALEELEEYGKEFLVEADLFPLRMQQAHLWQQRGNIENVETIVKRLQEAKIENQSNATFMKFHFLLAELAYQQENYSEGKAALEKVLSRAQRLADLGLQWRSLVGLGLMHEKTDEPELAMSFYEKALTLQEKFSPGLGFAKDFTTYKLALSSEEFHRRHVQLLVEAQSSQRAWHVWMTGVAIKQARDLSLLVNFETFSGETRSQLFEAEQLQDDIFLMQLKTASAPELDAKQQQLSQVVAKIAAKNATLSRCFRITVPTQQILAKNLSPQALLINFMAGDERSFVWTLDASGKLIFSALEIDKKTLQARILDYQKLLQNIASYQMAGDDLAKILLGPIQTLIQRKKELIFTSDTSFLNLNFATLPYRGGFLFDAFALAYLNSNLDLKSESEIFLGPEAKSLILAGEEVYIKEMQVAERFFPQTKHISAKASEKFDVAHVAVRSVSLSSEPLDVGFRGIDLAESQVYSDVFVVSQDWDGVLDPLLKDASWRTLKDKLALQGAKFAITNSNRIDDVSGAIMTKRIYRGLRAGLAPMQAVQQAQQHMKMAYKHPAYWAGYQLTRF